MKLLDKFHGLEFDFKKIQHVSSSDDNESMTKELEMMYWDWGETDRKRLFHPKESWANIYSKEEVEKWMRNALESWN